MTAADCALLIKHLEDNPRDAEEFYIRFRAALFEEQAGEVLGVLREGGTAILTQRALEHIVYRHWSTSGFTDAGKFARGTTARRLRAMIRETVENALQGNALVYLNNAQRGGIIIEYTFKSPIGLSKAGLESSRLRVVIDEYGEVITAFPI